MSTKKLLKWFNKWVHECSYNHDCHDCKKAGECAKAYLIIKELIGGKMITTENMITREFKKLRFVDEVKFGATIEKKCVVTFKTKKKTHDAKKINKLISQELKILDKLPDDVFIDFEYHQKGE